jgi:hypothetical protein
LGVIVIASFEDTRLGSIIVVKVDLTLLVFQGSAGESEAACWQAQKLNYKYNATEPSASSQTQDPSVETG